LTGVRKILVVDDEPKILSTVKAYLENSAYAVYTASNGIEALTRNREHSPNLIILDLMLPDISGEQVCEIIRANSMVPIILLTAKSWEDSIVYGLKIGADDYVTKPFSPKQLVAKVDAILRRSYATNTSESDRLDFGDITINNIAHTVKKGGQHVNLTPNEYNILLSMLKAPGKLFTRKELIFIAFGPDYLSDERMIDSYIKQLRHKLVDDPRHPQYIKTVHGLGYRLGGEVA
jgi:DNA-binding response OmpR family regulator